MTLTPRTLNGRFATVTVVFLVLLLAFSVYSYTLVSHSTDENYQSLKVSNDLSNVIHEFTESRQKVESVLHQYASMLSQDKQDELLFHLQDAQLHASRLSNKKAIKGDPKLFKEVSSLITNVNKLNDVIYQYLQIMQNVESRYPGMPILLGKMEPNNRKFSEAVELALQEGELTEFRPNVIESDHYRVMQLFQEARYAWSMQVSWFRVFVANRMGAFGEPEAAMKSNLKNRKMFIDTVSETLDKLDKLNKQDVLGIQQEESIQQMREAVIDYNKHMADATSIYFSENWRADVALIQNRLQPTLDKVAKNSEIIEKYIYKLDYQTNEKSQSTAKLLSKYILSFTAIVFAMMLTAFLIFQRNIRRPVLNLASRMQSDPLTGSLAQEEFGNMEEINQLVTAYDDMRNQVYNRQRRLQSILNNAAEGIITIDMSGIVETFNTAAQNLFGYSSTEMIGRKFSSLLSINSSDSSEAEIERKLVSGDLSATHGAKELKARRKGGCEFVMSLKISEMTIGDKHLYTAIVDDVTERRAAMDHLRHMAEHDSLTNLYNRQYFNDVLAREFERSMRVGQSVFACLYIDLDNFKYINDTLGHMEGDRLLMGIAHTLKSRTRKSDILARLGGDEFALIITNVDQEQAAQVADDYRNAIASYNFTVKGKKVDTGCSIGVALFENDLQDKEALLARADLACHMAKREGRNRVYLFENEDKDRIESFSEEMGWTRRIRDALENDDFVFNCQPILQVEDKEIFSYELLLRMTDTDTGEYIMPSGFFDSADRFGLMPEIDRWVVEHAFKWIDQQPLNNKLNYFINLSGSSIGDPQLLETINRSMDGLSLDPSRIVFEITENVAIADFEKAKRFLVELNSLGFKTALDDFGVGYSSFSYLRELDVDYIKIDGSFINSMHTDELNYALVKAINDVCHILGKMTIAEYVQNDDSVNLLKEIGVDYAQGYNIATAEDYDQQTIEFKVVGM